MAEKNEIQPVNQSTTATKAVTEDFLFYQAWFARIQEQKGEEKDQDDLKFQALLKGAW